MLESEDTGERASTQAGRGQNLVYTLPYTTDSIAEFLTPALSRIDPSTGGTQVVVITRDPETALTISETILRISGSAGIEVVPVTNAARAARLFKSRPVLAVAGTAVELSGLVRASLLKLETVRTVVLAWADDILDAGPESVASLEAVLGELGDAARIIVTRKTTPPIDDLIERYARRSRRVGLAETEAPQMPENYEFPILKYLTVGASVRPAALRRLLDDLDPPSTLVVARDASFVETARQTIRTLGYHEDDPAVRVTRDDFGAPAHTVIFYQPPVTPAELQRAAQVKPVQIVALAQPGEVAWLRELASGRLAPINLHGAERRAHDREESVRQELRAVVTKGVPPREIISLEPLLQEFDASELAAAALHLLERERAQRRAAAENIPTAAKPRPSDGDRGGAFGGMTRLFMTIGTRDGVTTGDLMGTIAGEGGIPADRVGKIDLRESHALVEVSSADAAGVIERVNGKMIKGRRVVVRGERDKEDRERSAGARGGSDRGGSDRGGPPRGGSDRPRRSGPPDRGGSRERGSFERDRSSSRGGPPNRGRGGPPDRKRDRS